MPRDQATTEVEDNTTVPNASQRGNQRRLSIKVKAQVNFGRVRYGTHIFRTSAEEGFWYAIPYNQSQNST